MSCHAEFAYPSLPSANAASCWQFVVTLQTIHDTGFLYQLLIKLLISWCTDAANNGILESKGVSWLLVVGVPMVPISWQEMQCPQTKAIEKRKVAKA